MEDTISSTPPAPVTYETELFKGQPVIVLRKGKFPFSLGYSKCKLILENLEKIQAFVAHEETLKTAFNRADYQQKVYNAKEANG